MVCFLAAFVLLACTTGAEKGSVSIENTPWNLEQIRIPGGRMTDVLNDTTISALFRNDNLSGNDGCNQYSASYTINGDKISIIPGVSTMMACPDAVMEQAKGYIQNLADTTTYLVDGRTLELRNNAGDVILQFSEESE
jgi:heat shock protein HslJ